MMIFAQKIGWMVALSLWTLIPTTAPLSISSSTIEEIINLTQEVQNPPVPKISHIPSPEILKALYVTFYSFQSNSKLSKVIQVVKESDVNSLIIDIRPQKEGGLFKISDEKAKEVLDDLHNQNIYLVARITAFKDDETGAWYDPSSKTRWEAIKKASLRAIELGFDEINYDYMRFPGPSEPNNPTPLEQRRSIMMSFFEFLNKEVRQVSGQPISIDVFGNIFIHPEIRIGQYMEDAAKNFDYLMPMPYPSHWMPGSFGLKSPGANPYETVFQGLNTGWQKIKDDPTKIAALRSWIQSFNLESIYPLKARVYSAKDIQAQIKACEDAGCVGWALWNANSSYQSDYFVNTTPEEKTIQ